MRSFGGPIAHLSYFRAAFVERRRWVDDATFGEIVALCSFLPGPTSSQVGMLLGTLRAGAGGAFAAWLGFTLPSAILMTLVATGLPLARSTWWIHLLLLVAVAVVADAILTMARTLTPDLLRGALALVCAALVLALPGTVGQLAVLGLGALAGLAFLRREAEAPAPLAFPLSRGTAASVLVLFALVAVALWVFARLSPDVALAAAFFRAGSLVFGGGHVVLPLLSASFVPGWLDETRFLAGYGAAQAMPGPLFTFAAYLGALAAIGPGGALGAIVGTCAIFAPSFFLIFGVVPFWREIRANVLAAAAIRGLGAAVVGLLLGAFVNPILPNAIHDWIDALLALAVFGLVRVRRELVRRRTNTTNA